jgi:syringomycin synthetase protein SyrE
VDELRSLLLTLLLKDVRVLVEDEKLVIDDPKHALSAQDLEVIRAHEDALVTLLKGAENADSFGVLRPKSRGERVPLSYAQEGLWFDHKFGAENRLSVALRMRGALQKSALLGALNTMVQRHEVLRTTFYLSAGEPSQRISKNFPFNLHDVDLSAGTDEERESMLRRIMHEEECTPFDLDNGPLIRGQLIRLADDEHVLLVAIHHIAADGWSLNVMSKEIATLYVANCKGESDPLPPLPIQYADYAIWQRESINGPALQDLMDYWHRQLLGASGYLKALTDLGVPSAPNRKRAGVYRFQLPPKMRASLADVATANKVTLFILLLAAFQILLARLSGNSDIAVLSPAAERSREELEDLIGCFVNNLVFRVRIDDGLLLTELLSRVKKIVFEAFEHQDLPYQKIVADLYPDPGARSANSFAVFLLTKPLPLKFQLPGLTLERIKHESFDQETDAAEEGFSLVLEERDGGLDGRFYSASASFSPQGLERISLRFVRLLEQIVQRPKLALDDLDLSLPVDCSLVANRVTITQQMIWAGLRAHPDNVNGDLYDAIRLPGKIDTVLFERAVRHLIARTTVLRLQFKQESDGLLSQKILPVREISVPVVDLSQEPIPERSAQTWIDEASCHSIDPLGETPFVYALLKLADDEFIWYRYHHQLIVDYIGTSVITQRLAREYAALLRGEKCSATPDTEAYLQYLYADAEYRYKPALIRDRRYWLANSRGAVPVTLSIRARPSLIRGGIIASQSASAELVHGLGRVAAAAKLSLSKFLIAALVLYLRKATGVTKLCIGLQTHGRVEEVTQGLAARCSSILPVQFTADDDSSLSEFLTSTVRQIENSTRHGRFHVEEMQRAGKPLTYSLQFFNISVNVLPLIKQRQAEADSERMLRISLEGSHRERDLTIFFAHGAGALSVTFSANARLYEQWEVESHMKGLFRLLEDLSRVSNIEEKTIEMCTRLHVDQMMVLQKFDATCVSFDQKALISRMFETQVRKTPGEVAIRHEGRQLTYSELNALANQLARYLRIRGIGPGQLVGVCMEHGIEMVVSLLGILKSGGACVPIDPTHPSARIEYMIDDSGIKILLTQERLPKHLPTRSMMILPLDSMLLALAGEDKSDLDHDAVGLMPEHPVYVIYKAEPTGNLTGSCIHHCGFLNLLHWYSTEFDFLTTDRVLILSPFGLNPTPKNILAPLLHGGQIYFAPEPFDPKCLIEILAQWRITIVSLAPGMFYALLAAECQETVFDALSSIRIVFFGCEPIDYRAVSAFFRACRHIQLVNTYSLAECSDVVAFHRIDADKIASDELETSVIGSPISNMALHITDRWLCPVPVGAVGDIHVVGVGVGSGYFNRADLSAERFIPNPLGLKPGERMYKTGDLGRWRADGTVEYLGRSEHQVEVRGLRVDLSDVEAQLEGHPDVREAAIALHKGEAGERSLVAYVVFRADPVELATLQSHLENVLPWYKIPSEMVVLNSLPLTSIGEIDRAALTALDARQPLIARYEAPRGEVEQTVAQIWEDLLGRNRVSRNDNFFYLGGHSLLAVRVIARINQALELEVPIRRLFDHPTLCRFSDSLIDLIVNSNKRELLDSILDDLERECSARVSQ